MDRYLELFDVLGEVARRRYQIAEQYFSTLGINHTEARLLTLLHKAGGEEAQETLSEELYVDRSNVGRALKLLEKKDFIRRHKDGIDKRTNLVQITSGGLKAAAEIKKLRKKMAQSFFGSLGESEADKIINLLRKALPDEKG